MVLRAGASLANGMERWTYRAGTDVPHFATFYHVVQRFHHLLSRGIPVQAMDLQDVDVCAQSLYAVVHRIEDVLPRQSDLVHQLAVVLHYGGDWWLLATGVNAKVAFGKDHDF